MYQPQQNQAKISPGLSALMELQRTAAATTPDGSPTVASQVAQQAQQNMQPQGQGIGQPPQGQASQGQGIASVAPNMPPAAQNAVVGAQIQQQQQEGAQKAMMQMAQQQQAAQQQQPVFAQGGIAGLPADNMHNMGRYARGGVLGFSGEKPEGSEVPEAEESESTIGRVFRSMLAGINKSVQEGKDKRKNTSDIVNTEPGLFESLTPTQRTAREQQVSELRGTDWDSSSPSSIDVGAGIKPNPIDMGIGRGKDGWDNVAAARPAAVVAKPPAAAAAPQSQTAKVPDAITAPNIPTLDETELVNLLKESKTLRAGRTDFEGENIKGIETAEAKRKALESQRVKESALARFAKFAAAAGKSYRPGAGGEAAFSFDEEQHKAAKENLQAETLAAADVRKQKELAYNVKIGDNAAAMQSQKELAALRQKQSEIGVHAAGQQYVAQMQARSDELRQMGENQRNAATNKAHLQASAMGQEGQRRIAALASQIARNAGRPEDAFDYVTAVEYIERAKAGPKTDIASQAEALKQQKAYQSGDGIRDKYSNPVEYARRMKDYAIRTGGGGGDEGGGGGGGGFTYVGPAGGK